LENFPAGLGPAPQKTSLFWYKRQGRASYRSIQSATRRSKRPPDFVGGGKTAFFNSRCI